MRAIEAVRTVCHGESAWPDHRALMEHAMPELTTARFQQVLRALTPGLVEAQEAARIIGIRGSSMAVLIRNRILNPVVSRGTARTHGTFLRAEVELIAAALAEAMPATEIVEEWGITLHGVEQLVCGGRLTIADHPAIAALYGGLHVTRTSFRALKAKLVNAGCNQEGDDGSAPTYRAEAGEPMKLKDAMATIGGREKPWAVVLATLADGVVAFSVRPTPGRLADRIIDQREARHRWGVRLDRRLMIDQGLGVVEKRDGGGAQGAPAAQTGGLRLLTNR